MGYFSCGTEGFDYQERWCFKCTHWDDEKGCPVWNTHQWRNYDECNNPDSILHILIPRTKDGLENEKCTMFLLAEGRQDAGMNRNWTLGYLGQVDQISR